MEDTLQSTKKYNFKLDWRILIIAVLIGVIIFLTQKPDKPIIKEVPVIVEVETPIIVGSTDIIENPEPIIKIEYIESPTNKKLIEDYKKANDSIEKLLLYIDAIKENDYELIYEDSIQKIVVYTKTRGKLLKQHATYTINPTTHQIETTIPIEVPKQNEFYYGGEIGLPVMGLKNTPVLKGNLLLKNKKDNILSLGFDTEGRAWIGYSKQF